MPVKAAMATIVKLESDWVIQWLIELIEILAPPFEGEKRGPAFAPILREIGGLDVRNDAVRKVTHGAKESAQVRPSCWPPILIPFLPKTWTRR
jgi:hypothetical protein